MAGPWKRSRRARRKVNSALQSGGRDVYRLATGGPAYALGRARKRRKRANKKWWGL